MRPSPQPTKSFRVDLVSRPKLSLPPKPKKWSHQDELEALKGSRIEIRFVGFMNWDPYILVDADAFTLKLTAVTGDKSVLTYYKHALIGFRAA